MPSPGACALHSVALLCFLTQRVTVVGVPMRSGGVPQCCTADARENVRLRVAGISVIVTLLVVVARMLTADTAGAVVPVNDRFIDAMPIAAMTGEMSGDTSEATRETQEPNPLGGAAGGSVWVRGGPPPPGQGRGTAGGGASAARCVGV